MNIFQPIKFIKNLFVKPNAKYLANQARDIEQYGEKFVPRRKSVPEKLVEEITPFRRKSAKPTNLSDNKWFIKNFEEQKGEEYLPNTWAKMTEQQKADYIVEDRYSSLVANKIMTKIKDEPNEHSFRLFRGDITSYAVGDEHSVQGEFSISDVRVHNHPIGTKIKNVKTEYVRKFLESICPDLYTSKCAFSGQDILGATVTREKSYVIDSNGHRFLFEPKINPKSPKEQIMNAMFFKEMMNKLDKENAIKLGEALAGLVSDMLVMSNKTSEKSRQQAIDFLNKYAFDVITPILGIFRENIYHSGKCKTEILDKVGKYKELGV